jgi:SAM-dependent methyltransferase
LRGDRAAARAFEVRVSRQQALRVAAPQIPDHDTVFEADRLDVADVTVIVPLYNYEAFIREALDSVAAQTLPGLDLVVVDDRSTDGSLGVALDWANVNAGRFNRISVLQNRSNSGLGATRNVAFEIAETPFVLPLDADNRLLPDCAAACLRTLQASAAAFAYPVIRKFGGDQGLLGAVTYNPVWLSNGNYIDAMALIAKGAWGVVGGYDHVRTGWEDFDLWCKFAERGLWGEQVPGGPFAEYRVHENSMNQTASTRAEEVRRMMEHLERRHSWLTIVGPVSDLLPSSAKPATLPTTGADGDRLKLLLPILRCPETGGRLTLVQDSTLASEDGSRHWPLVSGRPLLFPGMIDPKINQDSHLSNPLPETALALIHSTPGLVLHLSAGGTAQRFANVVEVEATIFRHTDLIADVHRLPFADGVFDAVIALNAFEHYRDPQRAAREIYRMLRPGGRVLIHTAFLQPLHESPWHFYNCTRHGLEAWFEKFETETLRVSENFHAGYSVSWLASECETELRTRLGDAAAEAFLATPAQILVSLWRVGDEQARRREPVWNHLRALPQDAQEKLAAGFEYLGRRPCPSDERRA